MKSSRETARSWEGAGRRKASFAQSNDRSEFAAARMSRRKLIQFLDNGGNFVRAISHPLVAGGNFQHCLVRITIQKLPSNCPTFVGTRSVMIGVTVTRFTHDTISCSSVNPARLQAFQYLLRDRHKTVPRNVSNRAGAPITGGAAIQWRCGSRTSSGGTSPTS